MNFFKGRFWDHFRNDVIEYPRTWWRRMWNWTPLYWLRCHTFTPYHLVDCRNSYYAPRPYRWGWHDRSELMLMACFNLLTDYVEKERCFEVIDWTWCDDARQTGVDIFELYWWWRFGRKMEWDALYAKGFAGHWTEYDALESKDTEQLLRLTRIHRSLWT